MDPETFFQLATVAASSHALGKVVVKSIEVVVAAIGAAASPELKLREAEAEAKAVVIRTRGDVEAEGIRRAQRRIDRAETRRQQNIESIGETAIQLLAETPAAASEGTASGSAEPQQPISVDWVNAFFARCQDVGDSEMQVLWAKVLSGEIRQPGTFDARTVHAVSLLSKHEAEIFTLYARYILMHSSVAYGVIRPADGRYLARKGLTAHHLERLDAIGLVTDKFSLRAQETAVELSYGSTVLSIQAHGRLPGGPPLLMPTALGHQLLRLLTVHLDPHYMQALVTELDPQRYRVTTRGDAARGDGRSLQANE